MEVIQSTRPMEDVLRHLTALDLTRFTDNVLQMLATIPDLQLKYLRLGETLDAFHLSAQEYEIITARYRDAFHQLLPKLWKLQVLETTFVPGVTNETIQLLTDLDLNLHFAVLANSCVTLESDQPHITHMVPGDPLDPNLLTEFRDRLLRRNADLDLSNFHFRITDRESRAQLLAADIGFKFPNIFSCNSRDEVVSELCYPAMRNRLNIHF